MCLVNNKEDERTKQIYKSASVLGKELSKQIKTIQVKPDLSGVLEEMANVVTMIMDQAEAQKMLSVFLKGEMTLKKKAIFLKSMIQRTKLSSDFEFMIKKLLAMKGMPEEEVRLLIEQKLAIIEEVEKQKEVDLAQEFKPALEKLAEKQLDVEQVTQELNEIVSRAVEAEMKTATKKLRSENERLSAQSKAFNAAFSGIDQGIAIFDAEEKIIFINKAAEQILGTAQNLDAQLLTILKIWQPGQVVSPENEKFSGILPNIKAVQKNESGQLSLILFNPLS
jgi:PAS domain-containing protein